MLERIDAMVSRTSTILIGTHFPLAGGRVERDSYAIAPRGASPNDSEPEVQRPSARSRYPVRATCRDVAIGYHFTVGSPGRGNRAMRRGAVETLREQIEVALGRREADLRLVGGRVVNLFSGEIEAATVTVHAGRVVGVGEDRPARRTIDVDGAYLAPSFIDGHMHLESSQLWLDEFARAIVPRGTGAVVADPHEIANVLGLQGVAALVDAAASLPLNIHFVVPSCVPASAHETSGAALGAAEVATALATDAYAGLGEVMNYPGVLAGEADILGKILAARARSLPIDGHSPGLGGRALDAYAVTGVGADHEAVTLDEAREKLRRGLFVMIREGSAARNLDALLALVTPSTAHRCAFISDDRDAATLLHEGHLDAILRAAVRGGLDPLLAIRLVTLNPAQFWRLDGVGAVAPGYFADIVALDDLRDFRAALVLHRGEVVARDGESVAVGAVAAPALLRGTMRAAPFSAESFRVPCPEGPTAAIEVVPDQIVTKRANARLRCVGGLAVADPAQDLAKLVVVERHQLSGNIGVAFVRGFGLRRGALASSVAHDAHNLIAVGMDDTDIFLALRTIVALDGGLAVVEAGNALAALALPLAGLLSDRPATEVVSGHQRLESAARQLGCHVPAPFPLLSFLALSVIPEIRLTDRGLIELD